MLALRIEDELVADAAAELERILLALPRRHGDAFRTLQRAIEALPDQPRTGPEVYSVASDGPVIVLVLAPPPEFTALIREAERLGV